MMETKFVNVSFALVEVEKTAEVALRVKATSETAGEVPEVFEALMPEIEYAHNDLWESHYLTMIEAEDRARQATDTFRKSMWSFYQTSQGKLLDPEGDARAQGKLENMLKTGLPNGLSFLRFERTRMYMSGKRVISVFDAKFRPTIQLHQLDGKYASLKEHHEQFGEALEILRVHTHDTEDSIQVKHNRLRKKLAAYILHVVAWAERNEAREPRARELLRPFVLLAEWAEEQRKAKEAEEAAKKAKEEKAKAAKTKEAKTESNPDGMPQMDKPPSKTSEGTDSSSAPAGESTEAPAQSS